MTLGLGFVHARLTTTGEALPRIPPLRGTLNLDIPYGGFTLSWSDRVPVDTRASVEKNGSEPYIAQESRMSQGYGI